MSWEWVIGEKIVLELMKLPSTKPKTSTMAAKNNREKYTEYFNSGGKVECQDNMLARGKA